MIIGSTSHYNPDAHFIKSIKMFNPSQKANTALKSNEKERNTVEYISLTEETLISDVIHQFSDEEDSLETMYENINNDLKIQNQKFMF